jgi:hypothetical protein
VLSRLFSHVLTGIVIVNNVEVTVFLVSLKAGGVALNLTEVRRSPFSSTCPNPYSMFRLLVYTLWIVGKLEQVHWSHIHFTYVILSRWNPAVEYRECKFIKAAKSC